MKAAVIGAGLAGCEAAKQLSRAGIPTYLYEMKPKKFSPAHKNENFAELVCSNSLKAERLNSAAGLLKAEMEMLSSVCVEAAKRTRVPAGGALSVDRDRFSALITENIKSDKNITVINEEVSVLPDADVVIVAAGPLDRFNTRSLRRRIIILRCGGTDSFGGQRRYGICLYTVEI